MEKSGSLLVRLNVECSVRFFRQEKEAWIKAKYVEKKFLKKMMNGEVVVNGGRKSERRWNTRKCRRHNSATTIPKPHRKYRQDPGSASPATLSSGNQYFFIITDCLRKYHGCVMFFDNSVLDNIMVLCEVLWCIYHGT